MIPKLLNLRQSYLAHSKAQKATVLEPRDIRTLLSASV